MATIGIRVMDKVGRQLTAMLQDYRNEIDEAYATTDESHLDVTMKVRFQSGRGPGVRHDTSISFVKEKVSDKATGETDEYQKELPFGPKVDKSRILFRDFSELAAQIRKRLDFWMADYHRRNNPLLRRSFKMAA